MKLSRQHLLALVLIAGCSSGAVSGTGPTNGLDNASDSGAKTDSGAKLDGGTSVEDDAGPADSGKQDAASTDANTSMDSSATDASVEAAVDAAVDAHADAPADAPADVAVVPDAAVDAGAVCTIDDGTWVGPLSEYDIVAKGKLWLIDADGTLLGSTPLANITGMAQGPCLGQVGTCHIDAVTWRDDLGAGEYHMVHGGKLWRLDILGNLLGSVTLTSSTEIANGPCLGKTSAQCTFEAGAWRSDLQQYHLVVDGKIWAINKDYTVAGSVDLESFPGVANGPCAGAGTCHVDAFTYVPGTTPEIHVIAKGSLYILDTAGTLKSTTPLLSIPGMAQGPCK